MKKTDLKKLKCWYVEFYDDEGSAPYFAQTKTLKTYRSCKRLINDINIAIKGYHVVIMYIDFAHLNKNQKYLDMTLEECKMYIEQNGDDYEINENIF